MPKTHIVDMEGLNCALARVQRELAGASLWNTRLANVEVFLVPVGGAYGWQHYGGDGSIHIPRWSLSKLRDWWRGAYVSLADVLRHEYGHAFADTHPRRVHSKRFRDVFGAHHEDESAFEYDPDFHVTSYAATNASEDFAETFMLYLRHRGRLPRHHATTTKRAKWKFIRSLTR